MKIKTLILGTFFLFANTSIQKFDFTPMPPETTSTDLVLYETPYNKLKKAKQVNKKSLRQANLISI